MKHIFENNNCSRNIKNMQSKINKSNNNIYLFQNKFILYFIRGDLLNDYC